MNVSRDQRWSCLVVGLLSLGMSGFGAFTAVSWLRARSWPAVVCHVDDAGIEFNEKEGQYRFHVRYRYAWQGEEYRSSAVREEYDGSWDIAEAERLLRAFPSGTWRTCRVNPREPSRAVLEHVGLMAPLGILCFGLIGGLYLSLVFFDRNDLLERMSGPFVGLFGLAIYTWAFGLPLARGLASRHWEPRTCTVVESQVRPTILHGNFTLFRVFWPDVVFRYEVDGVTYRANTVNASFVGTPWYYGPRGVVRRFPDGSETTCYVDPADPSDAVLDHSFSGTQWFGLYPLGMVVMGFVGIVTTMMGRELRTGSPRLWGTLILGAATTFVLTSFYATLLDLIRDRREGVAERPELGIVVILGFLSAALLLGWIGLAYGHATSGRGRVRVVKTSDEWA